MFTQMESIVIKYLNTTYRVCYPENEIVEPWDNNYQIYLDDLLTDLADIFELDYPTSVDIIKKWIRSHSEEFDIDEYWIATRNEWRKVAATAMSLDLVEVEPLEAPRGQIIYFDYVYSGAQDTAINYQVVDT